MLSAVLRAQVRDCSHNRRGPPPINPLKICLFLAWESQRLLLFAGFLDISCELLKQRPLSGTILPIQLLLTKCRVVNLYRGKTRSSRSHSRWFTEIHGAIATKISAPFRQSFPTNSVAKWNLLAPVCRHNPLHECFCLFAIHAMVRPDSEYDHFEPSRRQNRHSLGRCVG
jgi:hypothetical protein